jgi:hypothetical protein
MFVETLNTPVKVDRKDKITKLGASFLTDFPLLSKCLVSPQYP